MDLENLARIGQIKPHPRDAAELAQLLAAATRNLKDAGLAELSTETKFDCAYKAVMQSALVALMAAGYRPSTNIPGHQMTTIQSLTVTMGIEASRMIVLDALRRKRNLNDYLGADCPSQTRAAKLAPGHRVGAALESRTDVLGVHAKLTCGGLQVVMNKPMRALRFPLLLGLFFAGTAMATEEPPFKLVAEDGPFSVRDYPVLVVAEVSVSGDQDAAASAGFRLLAGYIFGGNSPGQRIAMTAPVVQAPRDGEKIAMTAPVMQTAQAGRWTVRFVMPAGYTLQTLPAPNDPRVKLLALPPARVAVVRFSGLANAPDVARQTALLREFVARKKLRASGPASLARYNPPWTLWFKRRNEVMLPLD